MFFSERGNYVIMLIVPLCCERRKHQISLGLKNLANATWAMSMSYLGREEFVSPADALKKGHLITLILFKLKIVFYSLSLYWMIFVFIFRMSCTKGWQNYDSDLLLINPRTYKWGRGLPPPRKVFLIFFLDNKTSALEVFCSC